MSAQMGGGGGGKKSGGGSSNSSMVNTPASTPISTMANGQQASPPPNNAPKYGTLVPNRIFVGGISANTTETELLQLFSNYGAVKAAKIIQDRAGVSKGYGFITFESEDDAKRLQRDQDNIVLRERKLNIAPAIKKQPFSRAFDGSSPPTVAPGFAPNFFPPASMPFFQGGLAYYPQPPTGPADPSSQPPAVFQTPSVYQQQSAPPQAAPYQPVMFPPPPIYMPQQYPMPMPYDINYYANGGAQYIGGNGNGGQNGGGQSLGGAGGQVPPPPQQQRPASPQRAVAAAHCYAQQMQNSAAAAAAAVGFPSQEMYYNMPLYQVEGAIYADPSGLDAMALGGGVVQEEYHQQQQQQHDDYHTAQAKGARVMMRPPHHTQHMVMAGGGGCGNAHQATPPPVEQQRQTATPVVSLLSLDHQQEKDLLSMQSGRRRKPPPSTPPAPVQQLHHGYLQAQHQQQQQHHMTAMPTRHAHAHTPHQQAAHALTNGYATYGPGVPVEYHHYAHIVPGYSTLAAPAHTHAQQAPKTNGWQTHNNNNSSNKRAPWKSYDPNYNAHARRSVDTTSSLSSPRTDSNSSASVVAEEAHAHAQTRHAGDEKRRYSQPNMRAPPYGHNHAHGYNPHRPSYHHSLSPAPPPPPPAGGYAHTGGSPLGQQQRRVFVPSGKTHYRNNYRPTTNGTPPPPPPPQSPAPPTYNHTTPAPSSGKSTPAPSIPPPSACANTAATTTTTPNDASSFHPQMQPMPQHFVAPSRHRSRRPMRRGGALGEIGAGDAPLTAVDGIQDACSKMDSLKL